MRIAFGALAPSLTEQLAGIVDEKTLSVLDEDAHAITRLLIRGYITPSVADRARKKLVKEISSVAKIDNEGVV